MKNQTAETDNNQQVKWQTLHYQLQDLLAGYVDGELDKQQAAIVEAHLAGCKPCRDDVQRQQALAFRLNRLGSQTVPEQMNQRLDQLMDETGNKHHQQPSWQSYFYQGINRITKNLRQLPLSPFYASGWVIALVLAIVLFLPVKTHTLVKTGSSHIPMIDDVLAQYQQLSHASLPVSDHTEKTVLPANWPDAHLLASWATTVGGASARVFAIRRGDQVLFQFRINEAVFFRNATVRQAVARRGQYQFHHHNIMVIAVPEKHAGLLIVGPTHAIPAIQQIKHQPGQVDV